MNHGAAEFTAISWLLKSSNTEQWRTSLLKLLTHYPSPDAANSVLQFMQDTIKVALDAVRNPSQSRGFPAFPVPLGSKPALLSLDPWKHVMLGLHFEITEPGTNRHLENLEVRVTDKVSEKSLCGFLAILERLKDLEWQAYQTLIMLENEAAISLLYAVERLRRSTCTEPPNDANLVGLMERYPDFMKCLGFKKKRESKPSNHKVAMNSRKFCVEWKDPGTHLPLCVELVLLGLYQHPDDVEVFV